MSAQTRELLAKHGPQRMGGLLLVALCGGAGVSAGCGSAPKKLFDESPTGGFAGLGGMKALGGSVGSGGASVASGGASVATGGASIASGGASTVSGGSAGDTGLGGGGAGTSGAGGKSSSGGVGGATGGAGPVLQSGSAAVIGFKGLHCGSVVFPSPFTAPDADIQIQASSVHPAATLIHGALAIWIQTVTTTGFDFCLVEDTDLNGSHLVSRLDWVAYAAPAVTSLGLVAGRFAVGAVSGRSCQSVSFPNAFAAAPHLQITTNRRGAANAPNDPTSVWVEDLTASNFRLCVEELEGADGELDGTNVDWLAYPGTFAGAGFSAGEQNVAAFDGVECVEIETGCANCENVQVSVNHRRRNEGATASHNSILVWAEDMTASGTLSVCVSETSAHGGEHDAHLSIDWLTRAKND